MTKTTLASGEAALLLFSGFVAALAITGLVRAYALRRAVIDVPNERSSHSTPTPRGGGLSVAVVFFALVGVLGWWGVVSGPVVQALIGGGIAVSAIGWVDDHRPVSPGWRAVVQFVAAAWAVYVMGGVPGLTVNGAVVPLGWAGSLAAVVGIVWVTNLYNFMDGIDGLAGTEAVTVGAGGALLLWWSGAPGLALTAAGLAAAAAGFLVWNWPPARIFMGDVGSGLIGFCFAVLAVASEHAGAVPVLAWVILLGVFIGDASFTLVRRVAGGERWYTAHRTHAYQRAVQTGMSHRGVTLAVLVINLLVLLPLAGLAVAYPVLQAWLLGAVVAGGWMLWLTVQRRWRNMVTQP